MTLRDAGGALGVSLAVLCAAPAWPAAAAPRDPGLVLRFLGNEGFSIEWNDRAILIDALQAVGQADHGELPAEVYADMLRRRAPFRNVPLVLVSHPHGDHFDVGTVTAFMEKHPECVLAASGAVLEPLRASAGAATVLERARELAAAPGATADVAGVRVTTLAMPHIASQMFTEPVVAHVVEVGGKRILHLSDAELADADLERLALAARGVDLAIVPYWAFARDGARDRLTRLLGARRIAAMRLPASGKQEARRKVQESFPEAIVLTRPMESVRL